MASGFRRYSTYRQATVAGAATNVVFGYLRCYVILAVAASAAGGRPGGYDSEQLVAYVWFGQGLIAVVQLWGWNDLADRIRSGDVVTDLLRPVHPVVSYLAVDLGRAGHAMLTRLVPPVVVGLLAFEMYAPRRWWTPPLSVASVLAATVLCFGCRYLVNAVSYWLLDPRGLNIAWAIVAGVLGGLYFPLRFLPDWLVVAVWVGTPLPSLLQAPLDIIVERDPAPVGLGIVALQVVWAVVILYACRVVQRRAERRMVIQGG